MNGKALVTVCGLGIALGLSGCGGSNSSATAGPPAPAIVDVNVVMHDKGSLDLLFNAGSGLCTSVNLGAALTGGATPPVRVELHDASGKLIGSKKLPKAGGTFTKAKGCTWWVSFNGVPKGNLYSAQVTDGTSKFEGSGPASHVSISF